MRSCKSSRTVRYIYFLVLWWISSPCWTCFQFLTIMCVLYGRNYQDCSQLHITARQYGEVVLPNAASGQSPGTPSTRGQKAVTVQGGYGALFAVRVQILLNIKSVAIQVWSEPRIYPQLQSMGKALVQCRGTKLIEARKLSRCIAT